VKEVYNVFFSVPIIDGVLDIDYNYMLENIIISPTEAYVKMKNGHIPRESWAEIDQAVFDALVPPEISQTREDRLAQLEQVIDTLLTGGEMA
jgi:hypothetical protein